MNNKTQTIMKQKLLLFIASLACAVCTWADGVEINGISYLLNEASLSASVTFDGAYYYAGSSYKGGITIPETVTYEETEYTVTSVGEYAFFYCTSLTGITLPNTIESIEYSAFFGCTGLAEITLPNSVINIKENAFNGCSTLKKVNLQESLKKIGYSAFAGCTSLTEIIFPSTVSSIGDHAFSNCTKLEAIYALSNTPPSIMTATFDQNAFTQATLYVQTGKKEVYEQKNIWKDFSNIVEMDLSGMKSTTSSDSSKQADACYDLNGKQHDKMQKGINIVRYNDGSSRKILVK